MVSFRDIEHASSILKPVVHETPLLTSRTFDRVSGNTVLLKAENLQRVGAFKIRGAYYAISRLSEEERRRGVVAHSSGNHAQGVALASSLLGVKATIVMPKTSPRNKIEATRGYGAGVVFCEDSSDDRERVARELEQQHGYVLVPPFDNDRIIAGQGTVGLEIAQSVENLDYAFVPVGGGRPHCRMRRGSQTRLPADQSDRGRNRGGERLRAIVSKEENCAHRSSGNHCRRDPDASGGNEEL